MGIKDLSKFLINNSPGAITICKREDYYGKIIAIDANHLIYQSTIAVCNSKDLVNSQGISTSHLQVILKKVIAYIKHGIIPVFVFDGKYPKAKQYTIDLRRKNREKAKEKLKKAKEENNEKEIIKFKKRSFHPSTEQMLMCKEMLYYLGIPIINAPFEAEAQCVDLFKNGKVWAVASDDMDVLTFGGDLIRSLKFSGKEKPRKYSIKTALKELELTMDQFIDLCILFGCDYSSTIPGIGPKKAFIGIKKYGNIDDFMKSLPERHNVNKTNFRHNIARKEFRTPDVIKDIDPVMRDVDTEGFKRFMCGEQGFNRQKMETDIFMYNDYLNKLTGRKKVRSSDEPFF
jgi:flap endonuclease-1